MIYYMSTRREGKERTLKTKQKHVKRKKFQDNETNKKQLIKSQEDI